MPRQLHLHRADSLNFNPGACNENSFLVVNRRHGNGCFVCRLFHAGKCNNIQRNNWP